MVGLPTRVLAARRSISRCRRTDTFCSCWTPAHTISAPSESDRTASCSHSPPWAACRQAPTDSPLDSPPARSRRETWKLMRTRAPCLHQGDTNAADGVEERLSGGILLLYGIALKKNDRAVGKVEHFPRFDRGSDGVAVDFPDLPVLIIVERVEKCVGGMVTAGEADVVHSGLCSGPNRRGSVTAMVNRPTPCPSLSATRRGRHRCRTTRTFLLPRLPHWRCPLPGDLSCSP